MSDLRRRVLVEIVHQTILRGLFLFIPAATFNFAAAWVLLGVIVTADLATRLYLVRHNPSLLERRTNHGSKEERSQQRAMQAMAQMAYLGMFLVCALDHRNDWSQVPVGTAIAGLALILAGSFVMFLAFRENSFASTLITVDADQHVVATGPYAKVRHPMYSGLLLTLTGTPLLLGSWWGLTLVAFTAAVVVLRLLDEEKYLTGNLTGYRDYTLQVRHRVAPALW